MRSKGAEVAVSDFGRRKPCDAPTAARLAFGERQHAQLGSARVLIALGFCEQPSQLSGLAEMPAGNKSESGSGFWLTVDTRTANTEESLAAYKLLEALRKGDAAQITPLLDEYAAADAGKKDAAAVSETGVLSEQTRTSTPLHLAVRCAKPNVVDIVFKRSPASINAQDSRGQTPLHLAAGLDRRDVLSYLLNQDEADDMVRDQSGKTCLEVAATAEAAGIINVSRGKWNEVFLAHLAAYVASPASDNPSTSSNRTSAILSPRLSTSSLHPPSPPIGTGSAVSAASGHVSNSAAEKLYHFIAKPRARCCDFALRDPNSGTTVLHEAVRRKDLGLIKLVLARGGDVLARDKRGKLPVDLAKDERIRSVLRHAANSEGQALQAAGATALPTPGAGAAPGQAGQGAPAKAPAMKGYLSKWTSVAKGGYKSRWFVLENGNLSYYRSQEDEGRASRGSINMSVAKLDPPGTDKLKFTVSNKLGGKSAPALYLKGNHPVEVMRWCDALRQNIELAGGEPALQRSNTLASMAAPSASTTGRRSSMHAPESVSGASPADSADEDDNETFNEESNAPPHADDFHLMAQSTKTQLELTQQLLDSLVIARPSSVFDADSGSLHGGEPVTERPESIRSSATSGRQQDVKDALRRSLASLEQLLDDYVDVVAQRERYFLRKAEKEAEAKRMWEESMKEVAAQHAAVELELQKSVRENTRRKRALQEVRLNLGAVTPGMSPRDGLSPRGSVVMGDEERARLRGLPEDGSQPLPSPLASPADGLGTPQSPAATIAPSRSRAPTVSLSPVRTRTRAGTTHQPLAPEQLGQLVDSALAHEDGTVSDDDDTDDEFFEAIEAGAIPLDEDATSPTTEQSDKSKKVLSAPAQDLVDRIDMTPYKGYEHLRQSLPITNDDRPSVSLWAILKGSIGKDLTKISFPVYFNEPTSMLERMAEDMEFSECLDAAAAEQDSTKRIAYVAAFAMSNYSSTIGRIAKPFNPMLSETFEYVDPRKKYRYISEQVSHHPPVSACIGQSPSWDYFGMVDAKSKFMGKSFEIRPTGTAHVTLRIPEAWADPSCPPSKNLPGLRDEHYSWLKVTTSVSNFLLGNPMIDHYGDMVVTNHRTGETCTLTFKPRGWRGGNACEIKGDVKDASGRKSWDIAGKWSSQLVARRVGAGSGELAPDVSVPTNSAGDVAPEYVRLWKNSVKPPNMPFNLTPFAITLNDINEDLKPWLPPTDCRLRPDQHAFEAGKFERANQLKTELEEHQRETRRKRERGDLPPHKPRWFERATDSDTGEPYWQPVRTEEGQLQYWEERTRVGKAKMQGERLEWNEVDPIFGEFQA
ncbi:hypothetical protein Rhopal_004181-T1 [Rhodotorula paludigena]|uniref:PH domain-containing protein n=1 Tax=Rhodotorula paludigena TaxID=86838 RepID=A0AAV5GR63_9BASI|nr:hypothetical protein Rhopal_004181-T1 [Rhodotorula paludigena]